MSKTILVVGATGNYGQPATRRLAQDGFDVRVFTRKREKALQKFGEAFPIFEGSVEDDDSLRRALAGCWGVHINLRGWWKDQSHDRVEHRGTANVARLAKEMGVQRLTYLTDIHAREEYAFLPHLKAKVDAEKAIRDSGIPFAIFACTFFMDTLHHLEAGKTVRVPKLPVSYHYLAAADYVHILSQAYQLPEAPNRRFEIYGPEPLQPHAMASLYCSIVRPHDRVVSVPRWLAAVYVRLTGQVNRQYSMRLLKFYRQVGEPGDASAADYPLGRPSTHFRDWCEAQRPAATA
jgi:uncharacterized protein YbjT (DUF2867 family)